MVKSEILFLQARGRHQGRPARHEAGAGRLRKNLCSCFGKGEIINHPKVSTRIPDPVNWTSFFNSMPAYIGGDVKVGGIKWAC